MRNAIDKFIIERFFFLKVEIFFIIRLKPKKCTFLLKFESLEFSFPSLKKWLPSKARAPRRVSLF